MVDIILVLCSNSISVLFHNSLHPFSMLLYERVHYDNMCLGYIVHSKPDDIYEYRHVYRQLPDLGPNEITRVRLVTGDTLSSFFWPHLCIFHSNVDVIYVPRMVIKPANICLIFIRLQL